MHLPIKKIVVVGGGSAGWMSAAMLARIFPKNKEIHVIESDAIGTVGVGEATIPPIQQFNSILGIDEHTFLKRTKGTYKLAIKFEGWGKLDDSYMHTFGHIGKSLNSVDFHHYWLLARSLGDSSSYWDYSINYQAATQYRYDKVDYLPQAKLPGLVRAYHFDAGLYAAMLREYSQARDVQRIEGKITSVKQNNDTRHIESVTLESGQVIDGDLFIDCSGFRGLLISDTLQTEFDNYTQWLPCDRAVAIPSESERSPVPYTRSIAHDAGWQWQIPLQHRVGNGLVYCSEFWDNDKALSILEANLPGKALREPNFIRFETGRREKQWNKNVVAMGLASGFLEPLESTSLHLIQSGIMRLIKLFPTSTDFAALQDEYNRQSKNEFEQIRDFLILHYHLNQRGSSACWTRCRDADIPDSLAHKIALFEQSGRVVRTEDELFSEIAWYQVMMGQNCIPASFHPLAHALPDDKRQVLLDSLKSIATGTAAKMPLHEDYLKRYCAE
jgi:tryptophan halogenase